MKQITCLVLSVLSAMIFAGETQTFRDKAGNVTGKAEKNGNRITYYDKSGNITGTATENGNRTTYRDKAGNLQKTKWK